MFETNITNNNLATANLAMASGAFTNYPDFRMMTTLTPKSKKEASVQTNVEFLSAKAKSIYNNSIDPNTAGFKRTIDTLTSIRQGIVEQKFYSLAPGLTPASFVPMEVSPGNNLWSDTILQYKSFQSSPDFEAGIVKSGRGQLQQVNVGLTSFTQEVRTWSNQMEYTVVELNQAAQSGQFNLIEAQEIARKKTWDLGIQQTMALGLRNDSAILGLLNQPTATVDNSTITKPFSEMTPEEFSAFLSTFLKTYLDNTGQTEYPNRLVISRNDMSGLAAPYSPIYPTGGSKIEYFRKAFREATGDNTAEILPLAYCDSSYNNLSTNRYALYRHDVSSLSMSIPINYTVLTANNTMNGFHFYNAAYGRFTGVVLKRPQEMLYFDF
jgi:hypothetical protein